MFLFLFLKSPSSYATPFIIISIVVGKKSKRKANKKSAARPVNQQLGLFSSAISSYTSASSFQNPFGNEPLPDNEWGREHRNAERELKRNPNDSGVIIRAAKASRVMRQFDKLSQIMKVAQSKGIVIEIVGADNQTLLQGWKEECASYKHRNTRVNEPQLQSLFSSVMKEGTNIDFTAFDHPTFSNTNGLQCVASRETYNSWRSLLLWGQH